MRKFILAINLLGALATVSATAQDRPRGGRGCKGYTIVKKEVPLGADVAHKAHLYGLWMEAARLEEFQRAQHKITLGDYARDEKNVQAAEAALVSARAEAGPRLAVIGDLLKRISKIRDERSLMTEQKAVTDALLDVEDAYLLGDLGDYLSQANLEAEDFVPTSCPAFADNVAHCEVVMGTLQMVGREVAAWRDRGVNYRDLNGATPVLKVLQGLQRREGVALEIASSDLSRSLERSSQALKTLEDQRATLKELETKISALEADRDTQRGYFDRSSQVLVRLEKAVTLQSVQTSIAQLTHEAFMIRTTIIEERESVECIGGGL